MFFFCLLYNINPNLNLNSADISGTHRFLQSALFFIAKAAEPDAVLTDLRTDADICKGSQFFTRH